MGERELYSIRKDTSVRPGDRVWVVRDRSYPREAERMFYSGLMYSGWIKVHPVRESAERGEYTEHVWDRAVFLSKQHAVRELSR